MWSVPGNGVVAPAGGGLVTSSPGAAEEFTPEGTVVERLPAPETYSLREKVYTTGPSSIAQVNQQRIPLGTSYAAVVGGLAQNGTAVGVTPPVGGNDYDQFVELGRWMRNASKSPRFASAPYRDRGRGIQRVRATGYSAGPSRVIILL